MRPIVNGLEEEFAGAVSVVWLNATEQQNSALQRRYGVQGHPSFVTLDAGSQVVDRFFGPQERIVLFEAMKEISPP